MPFSAMVSRLLISCPGDVPREDIAIVQHAITRWNGIYGESFGATVIPIHWSAHAAAQFGAPPQDVINKQLVDRCDAALALFANRMGTPTATAPSGTAEEIQRLHLAGKYVGILRCRRPVDPRSIDLEQAQQLQRFLDGIQKTSLVLDYDDAAMLSSQVDTLLAAAIAQDRGRMQVQLQGTGAAATPPAIAEVWPHIDTSEHVRTDARGRVRPERRWYLVLANTGTAPAHNVRAAITATGQGRGQWRLLAETAGEDPHIAVLAPHGQARFALVVAAESATQVECSVSWEDDRGRQQNTATLRLV